MDGIAVGLSCFRSADEASAAACASISGVTNAGVVSCSEPSVWIEGDSAQFSYRLTTTNVTSGSSTWVFVDSTLQLCEPKDLTYFGPVIAAFTLALAVILCARLLGNIFKRETL